MRAVLAVLGAALLSICATAAPAAALTADSMYEPETVVVIDLTLPPESVAALEADPAGEYVEGTFSLAETGGTPATMGPFSAPLTVGIRLKGGATFHGLDGKAAFKLKFNEFVKGQTFLGLKKMTLNNMVQDPSMVHETLAYEAFRGAGVAAPRTGYADVRVNGEGFGMHLNVETMDKVALERRFGKFEDPPQHLYEGAYGVDVSPGGAGLFEVDEGDEGDRSDLEALIGAAADGTPFGERLAPVADLDQMTRMWAVEKYIGHWDGYSGREYVNNYYLYSDPNGVFQMLPWGTDQTWGQPHLSFGPPGGLLFGLCLEDAECAGRYRQALVEVEAVVAGLDPSARASAIAALLAPWQDLESPPRKPFDATEIELGVKATKDFVAARPARLAAYLESFAAVDEPPGEDSPRGADEASERPKKRWLSRRLDVDRSRLGRGVLTVRVGLASAGAVGKRVWLVSAAGSHRACAARASAVAAGPVALSCRLSSFARRRLHRAALKARLEIEFRGTSGERESFSRWVTLPRQGVPGAGSLGPPGVRSNSRHTTTSLEEP